MYIKLLLGVSVLSTQTHLHEDTQICTPTRTSCKPDFRLPHNGITSSVAIALTSSLTTEPYSFYSII